MPVPTEGLPSTSRGAVAVVRTLLVDGPTSRADLSRRTGLTSAAVTKVVTPLADAGFLREGGKTLGGSPGRPASLVEVRGAAAYFAGVKLTGSEAVATLVDFTGAIRAATTRPLRSAEPAAVVGQVGELVQELTDDVPDSAERLRYVGVALAGEADPRTGVVISSPFLGWHEVSLGDDLEQRTGRPVVVENDVRALAAGEQWFGAGAGLASFAVVTLGAGIGCAICVDGRVLRGARGVSGELGHVAVADPARRCWCGGRGCVETVASTEALLRDVEAAAGRPVDDLEDAVRLGVQGDSAVRVVFQEVGRVLGLAVAAVANLAGPERVVLTGEGLSMFPLVEDSLRATLAEQAYGDLPELVPRPLGFDAWAHGAATVALQHFVRGRR